MKKTVLCFFVVAACAHLAGAGEKGWFGFGVGIKGEGFFLNPTLVSVTVDSIEAHSPAADKGIAVGDEITQVENTDVPGRKALDLRSLMQKQVGETLHLRLKRKNGEVYSVALVAAKRP